MRKLWTLLLLTVMVLFACENDKRFERVLDERIGNPQTTEIHIREYTPFEWDKAFLFQPYSTEAKMSEIMGIDYDDPKNIQMRDDIYLLVFVDNEEIIYSIELPRHGRDFGIQSSSYLTPKEDILYVDR